jgi:hypothetical protein
VAKQKVTVTTDLCIVPMTVHTYIPLPPGVGAPAFLPHLEIPVPAFWPPGNGAGLNKFTSSVFHLGLPIALEGHDCGILIVHVSVPVWPTNAVFVLIIPFSSRKMMFSASTVKMNGTATGTSDLLSVPTPMLACADPVSLPVCFPLTNATNTVCVGMTLGDYIAGYAAILITMAADALTADPFDWGSAIRGKLFGAGDLKEWVVKTGAGILTGLIKIVATGEGSFDIGVGNPLGGVKITVKKGDDGWSYEREFTYGTDKVTRKDDDRTDTEQSWLAKTEKATKKHPDGSSTVTETVTDYDWQGRPNSYTVVNEYDKGGRLTKSTGPLGTFEYGPDQEDHAAEAKDAILPEPEPL